MTRIPFQYGEFYDYPRMITLHHEGEWFFLISAFDEGADDYPDFYDVYLLPFRTQAALDANPCFWMDLSIAHPLGRIAIAEVGLDPTRRRTIDGEAFAKWLGARRGALSSSRSA